MKLIHTSIILLCNVIKFIIFIAETYDINRIIEYPGFNVEAPPGTIDVSDILPMHSPVYCKY